MTDVRKSVLLWSGLGAAFSPVLANLLFGITAGTDLYTLLAALLIGLLIARASSKPGIRRPAIGRALLIFGLALEVIGIASDSWSIARAGLPIAVLGAMLILGHPRLAIGALAFGLVPIPNFVYGITSPELESFLGSGAAAVTAAFGWPLQVGGPLLQHDGHRFELLAFDSGLLTMLVCAEVGWYFALRHGDEARRVVLCAVGWAAIGLVIHPVLLLLCVATLPLGWPTMGRFVLTHGVCVALASGVLWGELHRRRPGRERANAVDREEP